MADKKDSELTLKSSLVNGDSFRILDSETAVDANKNKMVALPTIKTVLGIETKEAIVEIGDWNMDAGSSTSFPHSLTFSEIRGTPSVMIINDAGTEKYSLSRVAIGASAVAGGIVEINSSNIQIGRATGGFFDSTDFDATPYNRGWVTIRYI